jgi:enamine deaminase RidA (YjgF/YER057c/UK114 family)
MDWGIGYRHEYWAGKKLAWPDVPETHAKFAQSVTVGNLVFLSGCVGQDTETGAPAPGIVEQQVGLALDKARAGLEAAGSAMAHVVKTFVLITDLDDYAKVRKTETEYYEAHAPDLIGRPPAATLMVVPSLARPEFKVEYEAIAVRDPAMPGWEVTYYPEYWAGKELAYPHVPKSHAKFARSQAIGNLVIVSGCQALDHDTVRVETDDFDAQSRLVLDKIRTAMEEAGGSLETLVKTNVFVKSPEHAARYREIERDYYREHAPQCLITPPATTAFVMKQLPRPEFLVETEAFGVIDVAAKGCDTKFHEHGVVAGKLLFLSGMDGSDHKSGRPAGGGIDVQVTAALDKVRIGLEAAGGTMDGVIKTCMMVKNLDDYPAMRAAELAYYQKYAPRLVSHPPASTFMAMPAITGPDALFQIDVTAVV